MGESSDTTMIDATPNGNNGTYPGTVALGQPGALTGDKATAIGFDGHTAGATVPSAPALRVTQVTIELWIKKNSESGYGMYLAKNYFQLLNNSYTGRLEFRVTSTPDPVLVSSTILALNTWYYVVVTYDGTIASLYINGKLDGTHPEVATVPPSEEALDLCQC